MMQLTMLGGQTVTPVDPYAVGDVLVTKFGRVVVQKIDRDAEAREPEVLVCVRLTDGSTCIVFPREITYRAR